MLFEYHLSEEECVRFCAARKEELQTPVEFFCVAIREGEVKKEAEKGIGG